MKSRIPVAAMRHAGTRLKVSTEDGFRNEIRSWNGESDGLFWSDGPVLDAELDGLAKLKAWAGRGLTPLHLAAAFGDFSVPLPQQDNNLVYLDEGYYQPPGSSSPWFTEEVLSIKAMATARTERGWTPLHFAAMFREDNFSLTWRCLNHAMATARTERGWTPLHFAAEYNKHPSTVEILLDPLGDTRPRRHRRRLLNARDEDGSTPLHLAAAFSETPSVVEKLLEAGANPKAKNAKGRIPWDLISDDSPLKGTDVYWWLREGRFE